MYVLFSFTSMHFQAFSIVLQCFDTIGWVIWPVKTLSPIWRDVKPYSLSLYILKWSKPSKLRGPWARRWINHKVCDVWPVRRQTCGHLPSLISPVPSHTAWWQRHTGVSSLSEAAAQWTRTPRRSINRKSDALPIVPARHSLGRRDEV